MRLFRDTLVMPLIICGWCRIGGGKNKIQHKRVSAAFPLLSVGLGAALELRAGRMVGNLEFAKWMCTETVSVDTRALTSEGQVIMGQDRKRGCRGSHGDHRYSSQPRSPALARRG